MLLAFGSTRLSLASGSDFKTELYCSRQNTIPYILWVWNDRNCFRPSARLPTPHYSDTDTVQIRVLGPYQRKTTRLGSNIQEPKAEPGEPFPGQIYWARNPFLTDVTILHHRLRLHLRCPIMEVAWMMTSSVELPLEPQLVLIRKNEGELFLGKNGEIHKEGNQQVPGNSNTLSRAPSIRSLEPRQGEKNPPGR